MADQIITSLPPPDSGAELSYHRLEDQLDLLNKVRASREIICGRDAGANLGWSDPPFWQVLNAGDDAVGLEQLEEDTDGMALQKARRTVGSMSAMSGARGMFYMEYR